MEQFHQVVGDAARKKTDSALLSLVPSARFRDQAGYLAVTVLNGDYTRNTTDTILQNFLNSHVYRISEHSYWVGCLSRLTWKLWERRMTNWLGVFNRVAFQGAVDLPDPANCSKLVHDFGRYALWSDNPVTFHLTTENLGWMDWQTEPYAKKRIDAGVFQNEADFLRWQIQQSENLIHYVCDVHRDMVNVGFYDTTAARFKELGEPMDDLILALKNHALWAQMVNLQIQYPDDEQLGLFRETALHITRRQLNLL